MPRGEEARPVDGLARARKGAEGDAARADLLAAAEASGMRKKWRARPEGDPIPTRGVERPLVGALSSGCCGVCLPGIFLVWAPPSTVFVLNSEYSPRLSPMDSPLVYSIIMKMPGRAGYAHGAVAGPAFWFSFRSVRSSDHVVRSRSVAPSVRPPPLSLPSLSLSVCSNPSRTPDRPVPLSQSGPCLCL